MDTNFDIRLICNSGRQKIISGFVICISILKRSFLGFSSGWLDGQHLHMISQNFAYNRF